MAVSHNKSVPHLRSDIVSLCKVGRRRQRLPQPIAHRTRSTAGPGSLPLGGDAQVLSPACDQRPADGRRILQPHSTEAGEGRRPNKRKHMTIDNSHIIRAMKSLNSSRDGKKFPRMDIIQKGRCGQLQDHKNERNGQIGNYFLQHFSEELESGFRDPFDSKGDWTEEYILEPRKFEKKRTIQELEMMEIEPVLCWSRRSKRQPRSGPQYKDKDDKQAPTKSKDCEVRKPSTNMHCHKDWLLHSHADPSISNFQSSEAVALQDTASLLTDYVILKDDRSKLALLQNLAEANDDNLSNNTHHISCQDVNPGSSRDMPAIAVQNNTVSSGDACVLIMPPIGTGCDNATICSQNTKISLHNKCLAMVDHCSDHSFTLIDQTKARMTLAHAGIREKNMASAAESVVKLIVPEGRRCGLCRGDSDGELPTSEKDAEDPTLEVAEGKDASHSEWERFESFSGWLGNLLGPLIDDRFGITGIWVHQECAIWSPEVYFAGTGQLRNVRAALRRGRLLKCNRCGHAGATIGCRVDCCQRTYHLPCARFDSCIFDHKKYLMACCEHKHLFLPRISHHIKGKSRLVERLELEKLMAERERVAKASLQKDLEDEEKWIDNTGEDEEFARREERRLQRDLARIIPVFVGGPDGKHYQENWDLLAGLKNVVQCIKEMVVLPLLYPEIFSSMGITPPRGLLLHGYPGTGKTLAVRALIGACSKGERRVAFFSRKGADCLGKYVGDAERELRLLFQVAEQHQPSIIFFDEIDGLAPKRSLHVDQTQKSVVSTLLALMDGLQSRGDVIVISATNRPDSLDPALRRPGRFDREIYFPLPSTVDRLSILDLHTRKWETPPSKHVLSFLARQTSGFAGADLQALCTQAAMISVKKVFPMKDILDGNEGGKRLALPSFTVKFSDWVAALKEMPLPCSRRMAKAATNEVLSSPLPCYMLPALLWPMVKLLIMLHLDQRIVLPPRLEKTAISVKNVLESSPYCMHLGFSSLECIQPVKNLELDSQRANLFKRLEEVLLDVGMIYNSETNQEEITDSCLQMPYKGSRFHIMLAGIDSDGLDTLSAWILHGFEGFAELRKLHLPIMLEEGGGDVLLGLLAILGEVKSTCPCVIYMPQIEMWAMEDSNVGSQLITSQSWNLFMQQVNLFPVGSPVIILASCGVPKDQITPDILKFFGMESNISEPSFSSLSESSFSCRESGIHFDVMNSNEASRSCVSSIPSAWIDLESCPESRLVLDKAAHFYAKLLTLEFTNLIYCTRKSLVLPDNCSGKQQKTESQVISQVLREDLLEDNSSQGFEKPVLKQKHENACFKDDADLGEFHDTVQINSCKQGVHSLLEDQPQLHEFDKQSLDSGPIEPLTDKWSMQQKALYIAIVTCGYQLLYDPKLDQLRRATSKLTDGPFISMKNMLKGSSSRCEDQKGDFSDGSSGQKKRHHQSPMKGLVAVGLLAYKGLYLMPSEVAYGIHCVLGLLRKKIDLKVRKGKNKLLFLQLQSQAAALEDHVFDWAFHLRSLEKEVQVPGSFINQMNLGKMYNLGYDFVCVPDSLAVRGRIMVDKNQQSSSPLQFDEALHVGTVDTDGKTSPCRNTLGESQLGNKHESDKSEVLPTDQFFLVKTWNYCFSCFHQVEYMLCELFYGFWRLKGTSNSLVAINDVIGTCVRSVSTSLASADVHYVNIYDLKSISQVSVTCDTLSCACVKDHTYYMTLCRNKKSDSAAIRNECKDSDDDSKLQSLLARGSTARNDKTYNGFLPSNSLKICLCPLIQKISSLIPLVG